MKFSAFRAGHQAVPSSARAGADALDNFSFPHQSVRATFEIVCYCNHARNLNAPAISRSAPALARGAFCPSGGTGRRAGFRSQWPSLAVEVRILSWALGESSNLLHGSRLGLFCFARANRRVTIFGSFLRLRPRNVVLWKRGGHWLDCSSSRCPPATPAEGIRPRKTAEDEEALNTGEIGDCQYPPNSAPDANASVDPSTVEVAQTVPFDASDSSYEPEALE